MGRGDGFVHRGTRLSGVAGGAASDGITGSRWLTTAVGYSVMVHSGRPLDVP